MSKKKISFVIATYNRKDDLRETLESVLEQSYSHFEVVVVCNSDDDTPELFARGGPFDCDEVRYFHSKERMGVPMARNTGVEKATGDVIITIDDDAILEHPDVTQHIVDEFSQNPDLGVIAFRSENYYTREIAVKEFPDPPFNQRSPDEPFETTFFVGVGNAIRSQVFDEVGYYQDDFKYGVEELDLSLRIVDAGYRIKYDPKAVVLHKESPEGRLPDQEVIEKILENRIRTTIRNLPWRYVIVSTLVWSLHTLIRTNGDPRPVLAALKSVLCVRWELVEQRNVIDDNTIKKIKRKSGPLYWWWLGTPPYQIFKKIRLHQKG